MKQVIEATILILVFVFALVVADKLLMVLAANEFVQPQRWMVMSIYTAFWIPLLFWNRFLNRIFAESTSFPFLGLGIYLLFACFYLIQINSWPLVVLVSTPLIILAGALAYLGLKVTFEARLRGGITNENKTLQKAVSVMSMMVALVGTAFFFFEMYPNIEGAIAATSLVLFPIVYFFFSLLFVAAAYFTAERSRILPYIYVPCLLLSWFSADFFFESLKFGNQLYSFLFFPAAALILLLCLVTQALRTGRNVRNS